jgi:manganese-transporting P-type ATPase
MLRLSRAKPSEADDDAPTCWFDYQFTRYCATSARQEFDPLSFPVGREAGHYLASVGKRAAAEVDAAQAKFGKNELHMPPPTFSELMVEHAFAPFFVFQIFCVGLWCLDEYWYYSLFTLFMLVSLEAIVVFQRVKQHDSLRAMRPVPTDVTVFRLGKWTVVPAVEVVPGDVVEVRSPDHKDAEAAKLRREAASMAAGPPTPDRLAKMLLGMGSSSASTQPDPSVVPADILLLRGTAVVNEAMLTGESIPQLKDALSLTSSAAEDEESEEARGAEHLAEPEVWMSQVSRNVVLSGTTLVSTSSGVAPPDGIPPPPHGGAVGYVLRTGFYTSQGDLMRTILFSTRRVTVENQDAYYFIAGLLVFALAASGYVLREGLAQEGRDVWKLVLHCILVITSVVPPELPVELSMAVNNSLASLSRKRVFCTEPFRIPNAGIVDACCFDKTGTLTSDQLIVRGIAYCGEDVTRAELEAGGASNIRKAKSGLLDSADTRVSLKAAGVAIVEAQSSRRNSWLVLAGCHAVVRAEGGLAGDPLEAAGLASIGWTVRADGTAVPLGSTEERPVMAGSGSKPNGGNWPSVSAGGSDDQVTVLHRWPFSSALRRMTTVAMVGPGVRVMCKGAPEAILPLLQSPPKGFSDAAMALSLAGGRVLAMAWKSVGGRVATEAAAKDVATKLTRKEAEKDLTFAGFLVLDCPLKLDSAEVVRHLRDAQEAVIMITGDHPLTAVAVAREVGILPKLPGMSLLPRHTPTVTLARAPPTTCVRLLQAVEDAHPLVASAGGDESPWWTKAEWQVVRRAHGTPPEITTEAVDPERLASTSLDALFPGEDVCVTGSGLGAILAEADREMRLARKSDSEDDLVGHRVEFESLGVAGKCAARLCSECVVFARVAPAQKERIITLLNSLGCGTLMCGDGTNDVGALKQASVGISIVSDPEMEDRVDQIETEKEALINAAKRFSTPAASTGRDDVVGELESALRERQLGKSERDQDRLSAVKRSKRQLRKGDGFDSDSEDEAAATAPKGSKKTMWNDPVKLVKQQLKLSGVARDSAEGRKRLAAARMQREFRELEMELAQESAMVQFGDASIAAPFTSKRPSPKVALDILLQGRCTLVTTHQMFRILAVNSLVASYTLSVLYLHGARTGDTQATVSGMAMTAFFMMLSFTKPLEALSKAKPDTTVFTSPLLLSVFGQFLIHLGAMMLAVHLCEPYVEFVPNPFLKDELKPTATPLPSVLSDDAAIAAAAAAAAMDVDDWEVGGFSGASASATPVPTLEQASVYVGGTEVQEIQMDGDFKPNVLNSVFFLLSTVQQATTFAVNYRGRPFMQNLWESASFSRGLAVLYGLAFLAASGWTDLQELLQLVPLPEELSTAVIAIMAADVLLCFGLEFGLRKWFKVATE